ncbi:MAG: hypothetical protein EOL87_07970, partial [Spartobacteria bacterium]|nr:hypothetical protein [Spartobacteria bacterium]
MKNYETLLIELSEALQRDTPFDDCVVFFTRLGRQFETIYRHFQRLYGHLPEFDQHVSHLTQ